MLLENFALNSNNNFNVLTNLCTGIYLEKKTVKNLHKIMINVEKKGSYFETKNVSMRRHKSIY